MSEESFQEKVLKRVERNQVRRRRVEIRRRFVETGCSRREEGQKLDYGYQRRHDFVRLCAGNCRRHSWNLENLRRRLETFRKINH